MWFTVDDGAHWTQLKGGIPTTQARDLTIHRREQDLIVGTFGRGAFILDDYTALREVTSQALAEEARLFPLRDAYMFDELSQAVAAWGNVATPNPPYGALLTYHVSQLPAADTKLVLNISDATGKHVRRLELAKETGVQRIAWDLRGDPPPSQRDTTEQGGGRGGRGAGPGADDREQPQQFSGRGGVPQGPLAGPGRFQATLAKVTGETITPVGPPQTFAVIPLPR